MIPAQPIEAATAVHAIAAIAGLGGLLFLYLGPWQHCCADHADLKLRELCSRIGGLDRLARNGPDWIALDGALESAKAVLRKGPELTWIHLALLRPFKLPRDASLLEAAAKRAETYEIRNALDDCANEADRILRRMIAAKSPGMAACRWVAGFVRRRATPLNIALRAADILGRA